MELLQIFPHLNAALNASSGVFLIFGFYFLLKTQVHKHRTCMISASVISALFL
ncbi:MAG: DUF420 domain-containing protein, partial [Pyrinomonadaceae bacterium]